MLLAVTIGLTSLMSANQLGKQLESTNLRLNNEEKAIGIFGGFCTVIIYERCGDGTINIVRQFTRWTESDEECKSLQKKSEGFEQVGLNSELLTGL
ncbi:hypothetical protein [Amniculibacterium sp. G2-70]|jgi:hypothetical protein|uniref:hypothetical protein n=1 Tax=Amniculibacterium sp. G2-70 TaxID=2767188 RepID=UPI001654B0F1|nr:hypothetical protein [Amniculibacterium sp. G2-70]